jgi:hypothetical protein
VEVREPVLVAGREKLATAESPRGRMILSQIRTLGDPGEHRGLDGVERLARARKLAEDPWTWDLVVVVELQKAASDLDMDAGTFVGGLAVGSAYVFDYAAGAIVCAGRFVSQSSDTLRGVKPGGAAAVAEVDLLRRTAEGAFNNLRMVSPTSRTGSEAADGGDGGPLEADAGGAGATASRFHRGPPNDAYDLREQYLFITKRDVPFLFGAEPRLAEATLAAILERQLPAISRMSLPRLQGLAPRQDEADQVGIHFWLPTVTLQRVQDEAMRRDTSLSFVVRAAVALERRAAAP